MHGKYLRMGRGMGLPVVAVALGLFGGCQPAEEGAGETKLGEGAEVGMVVSEGTAVAQEENVPESDVASTPAPPVDMWSPERSGFARHLSADSSIFVEVRHLDVVWDWAEQFKDNDVVQQLTEALESPEKIADAIEAAGVEGLEEVPVEDLQELREEFGKESMEALRDMFGEEVFLAARGIDWWMDPLVFYQEHTNRQMMATMVETISNLGFGDLDEEEVIEEEFAKIAARFRERLDEVEGKPVLGFLMGGKVDEGKVEVSKSIKSWLAKAVDESDEAIAHSFEHRGVTWTGLKVAWPDPGTSDDYEEFLKNIDEDDWKAIVGRLVELPLIVACAEVGDYVVLYTGLGEHSLGLAESPSESLAARKEMQFLREFEADSLLGTWWVQEELVDSLHRMGSSEPMWDGLGEGLTKSTKLETAPLMAESLKKIAALAKEQEAGEAHASVGTLVMDDGLRLEMRGGWHGVGLDLETPLALAGAMQGRDEAVLMRAHWKMSEAYVDRGMQQIEELVQIARHIGTEMQTGMEDDPEDGEEDDEMDDAEREKKKRMAEIYRTEFVKSIEDLWKGYRDHFRKAVGSEAALMVDLDGEAPPIIGLDAEIMKKGRIPRVAFLRPVDSREDLRKTWELWRASGVSLLGLLSEALEQPIPFPDTLSADKNDLRTHFFAMPFASEDFLPCLSVSDELMVMGTSKKFSEELYESIVGPPVEEGAPSGVIVEIKGRALWDFCEAWLDVQDAKAKALSEMDEEPEEAEPDVGVDSEDLEKQLKEALNRAHEEGADEAEPLADLGLGEGLELEFDGEIEGLDGPVGVDVEQAAEAVMEALDVDADISLPGILREGINHARWFQGASYRRWIDDGVPRSSCRIRWGEPGGTLAD